MQLSDFSMTIPLTIPCSPIAEVVLIYDGCCITAGPSSKHSSPQERQVGVIQIPGGRKHPHEAFPLC